MALVINIDDINKNIDYIGIDEVGYGSWAGPLYICALKFIQIPTVLFYDSKSISPKRREELFVQIEQCARWNIGIASVAEINNLGLAKAYKNALLAAASVFSPPFVLDGVKKKYFDSLTIIGADQKVQAVAAASIIAKVLRDRYMQELSEQYPCYCWDKNKGYGTAKHAAAIKSFGLTKEHRNYNLSK